MPARARSFAGALVCALLLMLFAAASASADRHEVSLTVGSYNIHHARGVDDRLDLERIAGEIRRTRADVIGLQEVDRHWGERSEFADQAAWLAERLDMHVVYGANLDLDPVPPRVERRQYGTAILSKWPIRESRNTLLPRPAGGEQRGLLEAVIKARGAWVRVANTHLQHNSAVERSAQAQRIAELLDASVEPVVLVGDLNARPGDAELAPLMSRFVDTWVAGGDGGDGFTYPAEAPNARIDYVLASPAFSVREARVFPTLASDHLPLAASLSLARSSAARNASPRGDSR